MTPAAPAPALHALALPASPPLDPTVDEARSLLARELSKAAYADDRSLLDRVTEWLLEHVFGRQLGVGAAPGWVLPVVLAVVAALVVVVLVVRVRRSPVRRGPGTRPTGVLDEPHLDASAYRRRAREALAAGDHAAAAADAFRALAAASAERTLLDDVPARTAHEIGVALAPVFPVEAPGVRAAADLFDRAVYGRVSVGEDEARGVLELEERLASARPVLGRAGAGTTGTGTADAGTAGTDTAGTDLVAGASR